MVLSISSSLGQVDTVQLNVDQNIIYGTKAYMINNSKIFQDMLGLTIMVWRATKCGLMCHAMYFF